MQLWAVEDFNPKFRLPEWPPEESVRSCVTTGNGLCLLFLSEMKLQKTLSSSRGNPNSGSALLVMAVMVYVMFIGYQEWCCAVQIAVKNSCRVYLERSRARAGRRGWVNGGLEHPSRMTSMNLANVMLSYLKIHLSNGWFRKAQSSACGNLYFWQLIPDNWELFASWTLAFPL